MDFNVFQTFFLSLMVVSALTSLTTEGIKKILTEHNKTFPPNSLSGIVAAVLSAAISIGYCVVTGTGFTSQSVVYALALIFLSWLCAMVGYDKVSQTITQMKNKGKDDK